jgi:hypothetical protein
MKRTGTSELENRLNGHFATLRSVQRGKSNWPVYAAVTGSALAMATNAAAGSITYSGVLNVSTSPVVSVNTNPTVSSHTNGFRKVNILNSAGRYFSAGVHQQASTANLIRRGSAFLRTGTGGGFGGHIAFLLVNSGHTNQLQKLSFGNKISTNSPIAAGVWEGGSVDFAVESIKGPAVASVIASSGFPKSASAFAAFRLSTAGTLGAGGHHGLEYGWIRLSYELGANGLVNDVEIVDYAYAALGVQVTAGETSATPEPSTMAMALLAAGAAGVVALRRRRKSQNL